MLDQLFSVLLTARGIFYIILFFGGSIFVHELGHFLAAKSRGLKVDRFSIGFGPKILSWKGRGETEYRLSLLPLGGYVSIPQLAENEMVEGKSNSGNTPARKLSYLDKIVVFAAGAFFNILFAILCAIILWIAKTPSIDGFSSNIIGNVVETLEIRPGTIVPSPAAKAGIRPGDRILEIDGNPVETFKDITIKIALGSGRSPEGAPAAKLKIGRGDDEFYLDTSPALVSYNPRSGDFMRTLGVQPMMPLVVSDRNGTVELPSGLKSGDKIVAVDVLDGTGKHSIFSLPQYSELLKKSRDNAIMLTVSRGENAQEISVPITLKSTPSKRALGKISFVENKKTQELVLVPVPDDLQNFSEKAPRRNLIVLNALPENSSFVDSCPPGTKVSGLSATEGGIVAITSPHDLAKRFSKPQQALTLFLVKPNGDQPVITLSEATASVVPEQKILRAGIPLAHPETYVREAPWTQIANSISLTFSSIAGLVNPKSDIGVEHLNGIFSIADMYYEIAFDLRRVLMLTILINVNLAFLNLLPIPVFDGGHILFATIERLRRRPLPQKVLSAIQTAFVFLLLAFMGLILLRDYSRTRGNSDMRTLQLITEHQYFH